MAANNCSEAPGNSFQLTEPLQSRPNEGENLPVQPFVLEVTEI